MRVYAFDSISLSFSLHSKPIKHIYLSGQAVREDIDALLEWKNTRKAFDFDKNKPEGHVLKDEGKVAQKSE